MLNYIHKRLKQLLENTTTLSRKLFNLLLPLLRGGKHLVEKVLAYFLLLHLYFLYFATRRAGLVVLFLIGVLGFVGLRTTSEGYYYFNIIEAACILFIVYIWVVALLLYILFRIPGFEGWAFKQLGEERVRKLAY